MIVDVRLERVLLSGGKADVTHGTYTARSWGSYSGGTIHHRLAEVCVDMGVNDFSVGERGECHLAHWADDTVHARVSAIVKDL